MEKPKTQMPLRIPESLHELLKKSAQAEGVSLNQYCLYLLAHHAGQSEAYLNHKAEELLSFLEEAHQLQTEFNRIRKNTPSSSPAQETPSLRYQKLYG